MNHESRIKKANYVILNLIQDPLGVLRRCRNQFGMAAPQSGFTLIELLLVIALITSVGAMTTAYMARFLTQNAVLNTQDQLVGDLRKAQLYTMMGKKNLNWGVYYNSTTPNAIYLYGGTGTTFAARNTAFDETFSVNSTISMTNFDINFSSTNGKSNVSSGTTTTITITGTTAGETKQVSVNYQGMVTR